MKTVGIIVAGGRGARFGTKTPKQFLMLLGRSVLDWSLETFSNHPEISRTIIVIPKGDLGAYRHLRTMNIEVVEGGDSRTQSVQAGLKIANCDANDSVLIHDAARPGIRPAIISQLVSALQRADGAAPALPIADALKRRTDSAVADVSRDNLFAVQTPQAFKFGSISKALDDAGSFVDDLAALEAIGGRIELIPGVAALMKITHPGDLEHLERLLSPSTTSQRIGSGFDVHAFGDGDHVTLCGVEIAFDRGLAGHSDADVAWHALTDAILGAAALGDIGDHFPPSDPQWKDVSSEVFLSQAVELITADGWCVSNCDMTIICESPKIKPHRDAMRRRTADATGLPLDAVSVKATTTEQLGFTGRGEGIAAQASVILIKQG